MALPFDSGGTRGIVSGNTVLILIILAALGIRMILFVSLGPWDDDVVEQRALAGDARSYHLLATSIAKTGTFEKFDSGFYLRTPGYPLFIACACLVYCHHTWIVLSMKRGHSISAMPPDNATKGRPPPGHPVSICP